ncbi:alpha/beta fold hydrolase [Nocardia sp. CA-119907]|uniref:alpha/beta fold hydrolase n=1 Tax=Nocardia sp. CA-119907 TaxID=3239973 RepID=UPI003D95BDE2
MRRLRIHPQPSTTTRHSAFDASTHQTAAPGFPSASTSRRETLAATHPDASSFTVAAADGIRLSARRIGPASAPASVVYVHGMLTDSTHWSPLTEHLHQRLDGGIAQIVYDQRGHGRSEQTGPGVRTTLATLVDDLDTVLAHAHGAVVLVAHSVASLLVQAWVEHYPHRARALAGVVMFNGCPEFPWLPDSDVYDTRKRSRRRMSQLVRELTIYLYEPPTRYGLARRSVFADIGRGGHSANLDATLATLAAYGSTALTVETASILRSVPTWVLTGELDPVVAPSRSRHLAEHIWGDYDSVAGAGHSLPHTHPAAASEPILAALEVAYRTDQHDGGPP